ncbi:sensor histidine kinase [Luteibacter aegosomatissinici]|uniref:sensor histidine kinase n=1 Tax=Luteibacter aegosomatissinici TaxID=2911539 RepID=UPI001FFC2A4E|nr:sensor histidine kinase [Luteibacter aegosomatissinici]UPG94483.1 ATP-binding protein [Luteibacter aegosomatissinici]
MSNSRSFRVDARVLLSLGRESIKDHSTALVELIKNAYDADAQRVDIEIVGDDVVDPQKGLIRIADNGHGMSSADVDQKWLRVGYSEKRIRTMSKRGRRETGEKGIGRLSADRLGAILDLRSQQSPRGAVGIRVNWNDFETDGADITSVQVQNLADPKPKLPRLPNGDPAPSGTEIQIRELRQGWTSDDLNRLAVELSTLVAPGADNDDFQIWLTRPNAPAERLQSFYDASSELAFDGTFDSKGTLSYTITARSPHDPERRDIVVKDKIAWKASSKSTSSYSIGKVRVVLAFHLRSAASLAPGLSLRDLRQYLDRNAGVRMYRDRIRVKPYGDLDHPEGDWLGLAARKTRDPAGAGRTTFKFAANQVTGAVYIGRDSNKSLLDSAAREGLVQGPGFSTLRTAVLRCIQLLEGEYHRAFVAKKPVPSAPVQESVPEVIAGMKATLEGLTKQLSSPTDPRKAVEQAAARLRIATETFQRAEQRFEELANESVIYRGLATVGISSAVFGHETESALAQVKLSNGFVSEELDDEDPDLEACREEIAVANQAIDRVALWGQFSLVRIKRDKRKRTNVDVTRLLRGLVAEIKPLFDAKEISLRFSIAEGLAVRGFAMDVESVALNLLTNAYHAASLRTRARLVELKAWRTTPGNPIIKLSVADSGAGISKADLARIWDPLFSTKSDDKGNLVGTGLGLTIVSSIVREMNATADVVGKGPHGGALVEISMPSKVGSR